MSPNKQNVKTLYLVDVSSLFFRAYYAISTHLTSPKGLPTNALYGLLSMTYKFIKEKKANHIVYCFDHEKPSFRINIYPEYKANRSETPEDLKKQIPYIKKLISALGIPLVEKAGYEADDLIGSLSQSAQQKNFKVVIVSGDKDFAQLVSPAISMYDPMKEVSYDPEGVKNKWGVEPYQINDYLSIVGDISDNIPGVFGIGPKGAVKLLQEYKNLEKIYENLELIPKKIAEKLTTNKEKAFLSRKLARIVTDIDLEKSVPNYHRQPFQQESLKALLQELGFKTFITKLIPQTEKEQADKAPIFETRQQNTPPPLRRPLSSNLKLNKMSWQDFQSFIQPYGKVWVFPYNNKYFFAFKNKVIELTQDPLDSFQGAGHSLLPIYQFFVSRKIQWLGYDLKTIWRDFLSQEGAGTTGLESNSDLHFISDRYNGFHPLPHWCSLIAGYLVEGGPPGDFKSLCLKHTRENISDVCEPGQVYHLHKKLKKELEKKLSTMNMTELYEEVELPLISVLYEMENIGIKLQPETLKVKAEQLDQEIHHLETKIFDHTKHKFNISSPKQLADVLFTEMGLPTTKKTKTGYSTDINALSKIKLKHPVIPLIIQHREWFKLKTTYATALPPLINRKTNRLHTHFRQALTATGRLSSINPNLQNIPIKTERGREIRKAFVAEKNKKIISADYSQIELRILAHITKDSALLEAFQKDLDIHTATGSEIYSLPLRQVTPDLRRSAKAINFGLIYGQGPWALSESLNISVAQAKEIIARYFEKFKGVRAYMDSAVKMAHEMGYVKTLFGRRRFIPAIQSSHFQVKKGGERMAINAPIQGTASDIVKMAMIKLRDSLYSPLLLQVHDELIFECEDSLLEEETAKIKRYYGKYCELGSSLKSKYSHGR